MRWLSVAGCRRPRLLHGSFCYIQKYSTYKDIVRLADILGHSNVNTTRIYTMESGDTHKKQIEGIYQKLI